MEVVIPQSKEVFGDYFAGLPIARQAAEHFGNTVTILEPFPCPMVDEFRRVYRHHSCNERAFEQWCFETWLYLAEWMRVNKKEVVFKSDSDCMIFADLERAYRELGRPLATMPHADAFVTLQSAQLIEKFILNVFRYGTQRDWCGDIVSDLHLLAHYLPGIGARNLVDWEAIAVVDTNLFRADPADMFEDHKDIWFVNGQPAWRRGKGFARMLTIHCWGRAKTRMADIWGQAERSVTDGVPVRLTLGQ